MKMSLVLSITLAVLLMMSSNSEASCYSKASKICKKTYKNQRSFCLSAYKKNRPKCKILRKEYSKRCKEIKHHTKCKRVKKVPTEVTFRCENRAKRTLQNCFVSSNVNTNCEGQSKTCKQQCFRTCTICTIKHVAPCVTKCKQQFYVCKRQSAHQESLCKRRATRSKHLCHRAFKLQQWKIYLNCTRDRLIVNLRCQYRAYDRQNDFIYKEMDAKRACYNKASDQLKSCRLEAKMSCKK